MCRGYIYVVLQMQLLALNYALLSACGILRDCFAAAVCCFHGVGPKKLGHIG